MAKRKLIGVIIGSVDHEYEKDVSEYFNRAIIGQDVNLLYFCGSGLEQSQDGSQRYQTIYNLPNIKLLDGLILVLSPMIHQFTGQALEHLIDHLKQVPITSISIPIEGAYNVVLDNDHGMTEVVKHMEIHHPIKDICCIGGPLHNKEALERNNAYKKMRETSGLPFDETCFFEGDFRKSSGSEAIDYFLKKNGKVPSAIVATNDEMAIGAYQRLLELGYNVPGDVSLSGFDYIDTSKDFFLPITTYDQRLEEMCAIAFEGLMQMISGHQNPETVYHHGELIIRESCGCIDLPDEIQQGYVVKETSDGVDRMEAINRLEERLTSTEAMSDYENLLLRLIIPSQDYLLNINSYAQKMIEQLIDDLKNSQVDGKFLRYVNSLVNHLIFTEGKSDLTRLVEEIRGHFLSRTTNQAIGSQIKEILRASASIIRTGVRRQEKYHQYNFRQMYMMSRNVVRDLNNVMATEEVYHILQNSLPDYGISRCYIVQYKRPIEFAGVGTFIYPLMSDLVFAYENMQRTKGQSFVTTNMLPTNIIYNSEQNRLLFLALHSGDVHFGYAVFSMDGIDSLIYETLRSQISEAIKRQHMNMKRLEAEQALNNVLRELELSNELLRWQSVRDALTGLYNRRGFYQESEAYFLKVEALREPFYIIFGDIDKLKQINDHHGHKEGDYTIRRVGGALESGLPKNAIVARMSGDEFTALVPNVEGESEIKEHVLNIQKNLKQMNKEDGKPYQMNISLGYAAYDYDALTSMDDLLSLADHNQYRVKKRKN